MEILIFLNGSPLHNLLPQFKSKECQVSYSILKRISYDYLIHQMNRFANHAKLSYVAFCWNLTVITTTTNAILLLHLLDLIHNINLHYFHLQVRYCSH